MVETTVPAHIDDSVTEPKVRRYCEAESDAFLKGALRSLRVPMVNDPFAEAVALRKPHQLSVARRVGVEIPETLISTTQRAFVTSDGHEAAMASINLDRNQLGLHGDRVLTEEDLAHLDRLRHAPIIVQEKIEKGVDVRSSNVFGDAVYACG